MFVFDDTLVTKIYAYEFIPTSTLIKVLNVDSLNF